MGEMLEPSAIVEGSQDAGSDKEAGSVKGRLKGRKAEKRKEG